MHDTNDTSPRGGVTARFNKGAGYRLATIREVDPVNALKRAEGLAKKGETLARIHIRGSFSDLLWTPEGGWVTDAKARLLEANQRN